ncbi:MAG: S53 family peptidase [Bdellovibrionales bacterium]
MGLMSKGVLFGLLILSAAAEAKGVRAILRLKERISMEQLAADVVNPVSPRYGQYYSSEEIRELAAPSEESYRRILSQLGEEGFKIVGESPTHLWVTVEAESALYEQTFATQLRPQGARQALTLQALVPSRLEGVESVIGLDTTRKSHHKFQKMGPLATQPGGISQATIKAVYGFNALYKAGLSGKGQHIAIATYNGFNIADVRSFYTQSAIKPLPKVDQVKFNGTAKYDENSAGETQLDAEFAGMIAPGSSIHVFASSTNDDAGEAAMFTAILDDGRSHIVNYSWGGCEAQVADTHRAEMVKIFSRAVAQGVNILVASGDSGSDSCQDGTRLADWPAASPSVVAVGGTSLRVQNGVGVETAWSGSGGGISALFDLPIWQSALGSPFVKRSYPDVAFNADPATGEPVYIHQGGKAGWMVIGGTSMAAPQWAGFLALVGEARKLKRKADIGYLNPVLYAAKSAQRDSLFNDVTSGSNGGFSATTGWDAVTGFGSMKADVLLNYLTAL